MKKSLVLLYVVAVGILSAAAVPLTFDMSAASARMFPRTPVTSFKTAAYGKIASETIRLACPSGGRFRVTYDYRIRHPRTVGTDYVFCDVEAHSDVQGRLTGKRLYHTMPLPDNSAWFQQDQKVEVPAGTDFVKALFKVEDGGTVDFANVKIVPDRTEDRQEIEFMLHPYGYLDNRFAVGEGQVGLVLFGWRSRVRFLKHRDYVKAVLPAGFELIDTSWADPKTLVKERQADGSTLIKGRVKNPLPVVGNWYHMTDLGFLIRARGKVGHAGKMRISAIGDGKECTGGTEPELFVVPSFKVPQAKRYAMGCNHDWSYWNFPSKEGAEAYADFLKDMGVTWLQPDLDWCEGRQDLYDLWRSRGIRYITPENCEYLANGYTIGRSKALPEGDRFVSDGNPRVEAHAATCPVAVYEERPFFLTNVVPRLRQMLRGTDGMWCNWEPWEFREHGCFCTNCAKAFAAYLERPEAGVLSDWPKCIQKGGRFYDRRMDFRCREHAKIVRTLQKHIRTMTVSSDSLGFIPGIHWGELTELTRVRNYPEEVNPRYYLGDLACVNGWGPYVPYWCASVGPYNPNVGEGLVAWFAARCGRGNMMFEYGGKAPKLLGMSCGCAYETQPEWFENMLDATFFNGWFGNTPWWYPLGADARHWKAYANAAEKAARYEDFVLDGRRVDAKVQVAYKPGTDKRMPFPGGSTLPNVREEMLVQHAAYELGGKRIVAVANFDESPAEIDILHLDTRVKERRTIPASKCLVFEYDLPERNPVAKTLDSFVDSRRIAGVVSILSDRDYNLTVDCAGWADLENLKPMRTDTLFAIKASGKAVFCAAVMCAVDEGRIAFDHTAVKLLADGADDDAWTKAVPRLETAAGETYARYLQRKVFDPLGMKDTTFSPNEEQQRRIARAYSFDGERLRREQEPSRTGGVLYSTPSDMIRLMQMLSHRGVWKDKTVITCKTFDRVLTTVPQTNIKTGSSRLVFVMTTNRVGKAYCELKADWKKACDAMQGTAGDVRPIGVFDSGIGGLTVLEKLLGHPGLKGERFTYLGDQANMPYGNYDAAGKSAYLRELAVKDALFLVSDGYFKDGAAEEPTEKKVPAKIVVIACNTATAYGRDAADAVFKCVGARQKVIGVINAGVRSTLRTLAATKAEAPFAVGVMATPGTIASGAYPRTVAKECAASGVKVDVRVFSQGCPGLADAIELGTSDAEKIARDNLLSLIAQYRASGTKAPLRAVILGCTHYPFLMPTLEKTRRELGMDFAFVDPAVDTAEECYQALKAADMLSESASGAARVDAYVSVPSMSLPAGCIAKDGTLAKAYKYGRMPGQDEVTTKFVPLKSGTVDRDSLARLVKLLPQTRDALMRNGEL